VLPRAVPDGEGAVGIGERPRYERLAPLGEGGVGEVVLAVDHDIDRKVAIKRLRADRRDAVSLLRFADEVRVVGRLEHPSIVPVHDVGVDEAGQHFLVMKYVHGETLESIIEKLAAGDPTYLARFSHERRARVFLSILQAIRYAHERGIIHRDIKPANIMVGPHGEVTVMDWGLAKTVRRPSSAPATSGDSAAPPPGSEGPQRLLETQQGALLGTPLYMSPEQASGRTDALDERSDIYSLTVMLYELMTLEHPLADKQTLQEVLGAVLTHEYTRASLIAVALRVGAPCEYYHFMFKGLARDPAQRFQSVEEMERELETILNGQPQIHCHITLAKRAGGEALHWIDRHKVAFTVLFLAGLGVGLWGLISLAWTAVRLLA
jgi:serine/threonine-protein kinase